MKLKFFLLALLLLSATAQATESFVLQDIRIEGLQRISLGTAFNYLPLKVGETLDDAKAAAAVRALFKTGFFEDVKLGRDGNDLVIVVKERPSISKVEIFGNEEIDTEELKKALKQVGLKEGQIFNRSLLDQMQQELNRQYFNLGKYGAQIETTVTPQERNRVSIAIDIKEGSPAQIRQINIVGAHAFEESRLLKEFELSTPTMWSGMSGSGKYAKQQLRGDLEKLRSYYMDRGYINFNIESTQVSITPDKRDVYITINITEGQQYTVKDIKLAGNFVVPEEQLRALLQIQPGEIFSRRLVTESTSKISERLGVDGYAFANVNAVPDIDEAARTISLTLFIDPGRRVYVRRINITGNTKTRDEVVRREIRQMEGGWLSSPLVDRSKIRLQKLGFFDTVNVEMPAVPGTTDQVDLNFDVAEGSTGNFTAGIGYGQDQGFMFNMSVTLNNFLGTGKRVSAELNNSRVNEVYRLSYTNPYYTADGVSRGFDLSYRTTNAGQANLADYNTDSYGSSVNFGFPLSEYNRASLSLGFTNTSLTINDATAPQSYKDWVTANGSNYDIITASTGWSHDTRDRALFPERGVYSYLSAEVAVPGSDLRYFKLGLRQNWYQPLSKSFILSLGGELGYGDGYGNTSTMPFFENFYAGGSHSVRGFRGNTLGPRDTVTNNPIGGTTKVLGHMELFFPAPIEGTDRTLRLSLFVDAGNVFASGTDVKSSELRSAYGIASVWLTPVGALSFNWAWPLNTKPGDETEVFQFTIGAPF